MKLRMLFLGNDIKNVDHLEDILINRDNKIKKKKIIKKKKKKNKKKKIKKKKKIETGITAIILFNH